MRFSRGRERTILAFVTLHPELWKLTALTGSLLTDLLCCTRQALFFSCSKATTCSLYKWEETPPDL